ncbi:hypothetical protein BDW22DRAFT_1347237 [Trametopsis cervina]|nr:hypothetical protein BDW22DRAFT_1347237 [Trametopsis cervina]
MPSSLYILVSNGHSTGSFCDAESPARAGSELLKTRVTILVLSQTRKVATQDYCVVYAQSLEEAAKSGMLADPQRSTQHQQTAPPISHPYVTSTRVRRLFMGYCHLARLVSSEFCRANIHSFAPQARPPPSKTFVHETYQAHSISARNVLDLGSKWSNNGHSNPKFPPLLCLRAPGTIGLDP